jgi:pimeloyl-ACP methyl ester carboxylesterase
MDTAALKRPTCSGRRLAEADQLGGPTVVTEKAIRFGRESHLFGVLTLPDASSSPARTAAILLNAGLINHLGPHRLNVRLARYLAEHGIPCLRFDFSGVGESAVTSQPSPAPQVADVGDAIDRLVADSVARDFVLFGICAGGVYAYQSALKHERVSGVVLCDSYLYPTWKTKIFFYWMKIRSKASLLAFARKKIGALLGDKSSADPEGAALDVSTGSIPPDTYAEGLTKLERRGSWVAQVISGSYPNLYSYAGQFSERFRSYRFGEQITADYLFDTDHTFMTRAAQNRVADLVREKVLSAERGADLLDTKASANPGAR